VNILITGAAGAVGKVLRAGLTKRYDMLRLADIAPQAPAADGEEIVTFDATDLEAATRACQDIDCVIHLAGIPVEPAENAWTSLLPANIVGTYTIFEAARRAGVKRMIYASSNHVVGFYRRDQTVDVDVPVRPDTLYGATKVFGEAVGRLYADKHGMSVSCVRIGSFREAPEDKRQLATWISYEDTTHLFRQIIDAPDFHYFTVYGVSDNDGVFWSNRGLEWLGYNPTSRGQATAEQLEKWPDESPVALMFQGGEFCNQDFDGDPRKIK